MKLFKLNGNNSIIKLTLDQPLQLDEDENYGLGLVGLYSDIFIRNVNTELVSAFRFHINNEGYTFNLFRGHYFVKDLENRFKECLKACINTLK